MKIFLLEDDASIAMGLEYSLQKEGYETKRCADMQSALKAVESEDYDLYLLDLSLPDGSGYDVCRAVKAKGDRPVIFLTAFDDEVNVVMGFDLGADDYVSKPFRINELMARIKSVLRRYHSENYSGIVELHGIKINTNEAKVYKNGKEIVLTAMEYRLLLILLNNRGQIMTRNQLLENIWDIDGIFVNDNTLTVYIKRLRDKIEDDSLDPKIIKTVRKMGYILE